MLPTSDQKPNTVDLSLRQDIRQSYDVNPTTTGRRSQFVIAAQANISLISHNIREKCMTVPINIYKLSNYQMCFFLNEFCFCDKRGLKLYN